MGSPDRLPLLPAVSRAQSIVDGAFCRRPRRWSEAIERERRLCSGELGEDLVGKQRRAVGPWEVDELHHNFADAQVDKPLNWFDNAFGRADEVSETPLVERREQSP